MSALLFMASGKGGMTAGVKASPREAAADFFAKYPGVRKCNVAGVNEGPGDMVITVPGCMTWREVTRATVETLPEDSSNAQRL